jgi:hypothetical protein
MIEIARYVGPTVFGFSSSLILVLSVGLDLVDFGCCSWSSRELINSRITFGEYKIIAIYKSMAALLFLFFAPVVVLLSPTQSWFSTLFLFYPALWIHSNYIQQYLLSHSYISRAVILQIVERSLWLLVIPFSFFNMSKECAYILPILIGLFTHVALGRFSRPLDFKKNNLNSDFSFIKLFSKTRHFGITSVLSDSGNLDAPIIANFSSFADSASYSLAQRIRNPLKLFFQSFATRIRITGASRNKSQILTVFKTEFRFLIVGAISIVGASLFFYRFALEIFGSSFSDVNRIMGFGALIALPSGISAVSTGLLGSIGHEKFVSIATSIFTFASLLGLAFTVIAYGSFESILFLLAVNSIYASILCVFTVVQVRRL